MPLERKSDRLCTLFYFLKRYRTLGLVITASSVIVAFLESFNLAAIIPVIGSMVGASSAVGGSNVVVGLIRRIIFRMPLEDKVVASIILLLAVTGLKGVARIANEWVMAYSSGRIMYETKRGLMERLAGQEYRFFLEHKQGEIGYLLLNATAKVGTLIFKASQMISEFVMLIFITVLLFMLNAQAAVVCVMAGAVLSVIIGVIAKNISYILGRARLQAAANQSVMFNEFFNGIKQITVFGAKEGWLARFDEANKLFARLYIRDYVWLSMPTNAIEVLGVSTILAIVLAMRAHLGGDMVALIPLAGVFAMALLKSLPALGTIAKARMEILGALPDAEAVIALLERKPKTARQGGREFLGFKKSLVFDNVSFMHDISKPLLSGINLSIGKNTVTAIVGASGAGKTTLINLILGLFAPSSGKILIDGMDLAEYDIESFRRKIGFVSQEPFIFHSTIYENITFEENIYTKDGVMEAARLANIHDFIISLKDGYKTVAGERGMKLSGGEQQRIAIARAVIRRPDILILDEATSALDSVSEKEVQKAINNVSKMCTVIVIAHRLSTVKGADKISVLKDGRIVEEGSHERLMEGNGYYRMLYEHQAL